MALTAHPPKSRQLLARGQKFTLEYKFSHLALVWTENSQIYVTKLPNRQFDEKDLNELEGTLIPKEIVYPLWRENITEAKLPSSPDIYIKMPYHHCLHSKPNFNPMNTEIDILEILSRKPHPNIVQYYGCIRDGDYIVGICLRKYRCTLEEFLESKGPADQRPPPDADPIVSGIRAGLDFLHNLGLVHGDIKPENIMLDDEDRAVIIDFDSCRTIGTQSCGGTPGWSKKPTIAQIENDEYGLDLVTKFIQGGYDGQNFDAWGMFK